MEILKISKVNFFALFGVLSPKPVRKKCFEEKKFFFYFSLTLVVRIPYIYGMGLASKQNPPYSAKNRLSRKI